MKVYRNDEDVLAAAIEVIYKMDNEDMVDLAEHLLYMLRDKRYAQTKLLSLHDFVTCEPTRFGCPFGEVTRTSQFGNQYGPEWAEITWFKWNYVVPAERDETNTIKEIAHQRMDKPAYEFGLQRRSAPFIMYEYGHLLPWKLQMEKENNEDL